MMKFFRKYNKQLLAVFMALLMIVFIGGSALDSLMRPSMNRTLGTSKYGEITDRDLQGKKDHVTNILERMGKDWQRPFSSAGEPLQLLDWYLLVHEAEALGVASDVAEVKAATSAEETNEAVYLVADRLRVRPDAVHQAMAEYRSVQNAAIAIGAAAHPSEAEVQKIARDALEKVQIKAIVIPAKALVDQQPEPTAEELQAQFDKYRDKEPSGGLNFGYYRHPSARVEYVKIHRDTIMETIGVPNLERKARAYFNENRTKHLPFKRHPGNNPDPPPVAEGQTQSPEDAEYLTWDEGKHIAFAVIKKEEATAKAAEIANWIVRATGESFADVSRGENGYRLAPKEVTGSDYFADLLKRLPPASNFPSAMTIHTTEFFTVEESATVPVLGTARYQPERGPGSSFGAIVARSEAFIPQIPKTAGAAEAEYFSLYQTSPRPVQNTETGDYYVFRIIEKAPGRPAQSVEEVREKVVADVKLSKAFEAAKKRAGSLLASAANGTLVDAYNADVELVDLVAKHPDQNGGYYEPPAFSRIPEQMAAMGRSGNGNYVGPGVSRLSNEIIDQIFAMAETEKKREVIELPDRPASMLIEIVGLNRAVETEFNSLKTQLGDQLAAARWQRAVSNWLNPDQIRARNGFAFPKN